MQIGIDTTRATESKLVFVLDSDEITPAALAFMLQDHYETHELSDVEQLLAQGAQGRPDLILLGLPVVHTHGMVVLDILTGSNPQAKIILVADAFDDCLAQPCLQAGASGLLVKPLAVESVRRKVDRILGRRTVVTIPVMAV